MCSFKYYQLIANYCLRQDKLQNECVTELTHTARLLNSLRISLTSNQRHYVGYSLPVEALVKYPIIECETECLMFLLLMIIIDIAKL